MLRHVCVSLLLLMPVLGFADDQPTEVRRLTGFVAPVRKVSFSPDGKRMLTSSWAAKDQGKTHFGGCRIWNVSTGELVLKLTTKEHTFVLDAKYSPKGDRILTIGGLGHANGWASDCHLWSAEGKPLVDLSAHQVKACSDACLTPDGRHIISNASGIITIADANTGRELRRITNAKTQHALTLSPDGQLLVSGVEDTAKYAQVWDFETGAKLHKTRETKFGPEELLFSATGHRLLICSFEAAELLDGRTFKAVAELGDMRHGGFSPDSQLVATAHWTSMIHIWDATTGKQLLKFQGHPHHLASVTFLPDGKHVICAGGLDQKDDFGKPSKSFDAIIYRLPDSILSQVEVAVTPSRPPVPAADELEKARSEIRQIFEADFNKAKKPEARTELARRLSAEAGKSDSLVARYALLDEARLLAMSSGDVETVDRALTSLSDFDGPLTNARVESVKALVVSTKLPSELTKLSALCLESIEEALLEEQFDGAADLLKSASTVQTKSKDGTAKQRENLKQLQERVSHRKKQFEDMQAAQEVLSKSDSDADAHEKVGRYLCLARDDWNSGLAHLAAGADSKLKQAAMADISSPPEAAKQTEVGDGWYDAAKTAKPADRSAFLSRAKHWYEQAAPNATGLTKLRVEARLKEISGSQMPEKPRPGSK